MKFPRLEFRGEGGFGALEGGDSVRSDAGDIGSLLGPVVGSAPSRVIVRRGRRAVRKASAGRLLLFNGCRRLQ
jgi:hypothetical protein